MRASPLPATLTAALQTGERRSRKLETAIRELCDLMADIHGGVWTGDIDHDTHFVLIARAYEPEARS